MKSDPLPASPLLRKGEVQARCALVSLPSRSEGRVGVGWGGS